MKTISILGSVLGLMGGIAFADTIGDIAQSKCMKCHSPTAEFAQLGGQTPEYLYQSMLDYKSGARHSKYAKMMMTGRVASLDDATIKGLADYYSKIAAPPPVSGDKALVDAGKAIYEYSDASKGIQSCASCHGAAGEGSGNGNKLNPRLAGQLPDFTTAQLVNYKTGQIDNQKDMADAAKRLSDADMEAVAAYVQSL